MTSGSAVSEGITAIAADANGNAYVAGTASRVRPAGHAGSVEPRRRQATSPRSFAEMRAADGSPVFCTYLGLTNIGIYAVSLDALGDVYVAANRTSASSAFTATPGALSVGNQQLLVFKMNAGASSLLWSAGFGGNGSDAAYAMQLDPKGNALIVGSPSNGFPITPDALYPQPNGAFFAKVDSSGTKLDYASYGDGNQAYVIGVDSSGALYMAGVYPPVFLSKISPDGSQLVYRVPVQYRVAAISVDADGNATLVGADQGLSSMLALTATCRLGNSSYPAPSDATEAWMIRFDATGAMIQSTYLGSGPLGAGVLPLQPGAIASGPGGTYVTVSSSPYPYGGRPTAAGVLQIGPDSTGASATSIGCWSNAASFETGPLVAGEIFSVFGDGLGPAAGVSAMLVNGRFPGTRPTFR